MKSIYIFLLLTITSLYAFPVFNPHINSHTNHKSNLNKNRHHIIHHNTSKVLLEIDNHYNRTSKNLNLLTNIINSLKNNQQIELNNINKMVLDTDKDKSVISLKYLNVDNKIQSMIKSIIKLNETLSISHKKMLNDIKYLNTLDVIKPTFLNFMDNINHHINQTSFIIEDKIINDEHKENMQDLLNEIRDSYKNISISLSEEFLNHYKKYNNLLLRHKKVYNSKKLRIREIVKKYNETRYLRDNILYEYNEINKILKKLKRNYNSSQKEMKLLEILSEKIENILLNNKCHIKKFVNNTNCEIQLLQSHYDNDLI